MSRVIALAGFPPEVLAYAIAMYSRSALSIEESIKKVTEEKAGEFFETFYFAYGHKSIADNAHVAIALEDISQIAAFEIEDQSLWDGQERSTRYQKFDSRSDCFAIPKSFQGTYLEGKYVDFATFLLGEYAFFSQACFEYLVKVNSKPSKMNDAQYERTMRARAFDVARYWLFGGIKTSVGQVTSARSLEDQIIRLMTSEYPEVVELAEQMKDACMKPSILPTLIKYATANPFQAEMRKATRFWAERLSLHVSDRSGSKPYLENSYVDLTPSHSLEDEIIATLLYEGGHVSYRAVLDKVQHLSESERGKILEYAFEVRGKYDPLPRTYASGYQLIYDIVMDRGGERDLHRHRRCIQIHQQPTTVYGYNIPKIVFEAGLTPRYIKGMVRVPRIVAEFRDEVGVGANYLLPFAYRSRTLYKMDLAEAAYITELRSGVAGHFSYREVACKMYNLLVERYPFFEGKFRVTPFETENLLKR